jgi:hypothetical protein
MVLGVSVFVRESPAGHRMWEYSLCASALAFTMSRALVNSVMLDSVNLLVTWNYELIIL